MTLSHGLERLGLDERQQIRIDQIGMRGRHTVRQSGIGFERPVLQQFD
jgi:hypothetical protein